MCPDGWQRTTLTCRPLLRAANFDVAGITVVTAVGENEILPLLAFGSMSNKEIARELSIAEGTGSRSTLQPLLRHLVLAAARSRRLWPQDLAGGSRAGLTARPKTKRFVVDGVYSSADGFSLRENAASGLRPMPPLRRPSN